MLLLAAAYEKCTVYTWINYGREDCVAWTDCNSNKEFTLRIPESRGCKLWIGTNGEVLQMYGDGILQK